VAPQFAVEAATITNGIAHWSVGAGPGVLLVHGWEDDHSLWTPMIDPLIAAGFRVVAIDLPGHGFSPADMSPLPQVAQSVAALAAELGPFEAIIAHSYGCPISVVASAEYGLNARRYVLIAGARAQREQMERMGARHGLDAAATQALIALQEEKLGRSIDEMDLARFAPGMRALALFVHDVEDEACPVEGSELLARLWPQAELFITQGLGHRLIAQDRATIERVLQFLDGC
jgi:pimeloyl-ACP methyl ester carboxylesterase